MDCFASKANKSTVTLTAVSEDGFKDWVEKRSAAEQHWIDANGFKASPGSVLLLPGEAGKPGEALIGVAKDMPDKWSWGAAAARLPEGRYDLPKGMKTDHAEAAGLGWALGSYRFARYAKKGGPVSKLVLPTPAIKKRVEETAKALYLVRDLINTPASDMGPGELAHEARKLARQFKCKIDITVGDDLLSENFPMVHAVGRASSRAPRLIDMSWGKTKHPKVTLIGKGVCFDSGGLDLKTSGGMLMMKKDMGGAAHVLGLAHMIMAADLPVRLRVLIPAVENSVSGDAFRPWDVLSTRKGITVEVGNTDAEGRLVLADAITAALEDEPDLMVDFATLTGAARVAVGTEIAAYFCADDTLAGELETAAKGEDDPVWRLPLHPSYRKMLDSKIADISSTGSGGYAGATTAALFLQEFAGSKTPWIHFDIMAWNTATRPGRPEGGEAMGVRAMFEAIKQRFS
ncbi:leucyl aminopeptidase family protein [Hwanghaeella grinnelliae]|uniref:Leucyl aminopeptidase family protein n=1 Tax=Hwanghaeella grinnelliae TaxID=2500179 RepID=A0A3S2Y231_9PROT|nr:leucyl aminopeptidase family protein [Hwanghaeella grinnelliae]RVU35904.1 leucyl aminopeptidase family protein [Hwanghaeella grinnelliae]